MLCKYLNVDVCLNICHDVAIMYCMVVHHIFPVDTLLCIILLFSQILSLTYSLLQ